MSNTRKVIINSFWLILQPILLNLLSLFVIGYIARELGQAEYGKFVFAFSFVGIFLPLTNMGLNSLTTRDISENKTQADVILGKVLALRLALALVVYVVILLLINVMNYAGDTRTVVYIAALTLMFNGVAVTLHSAFQGFEKMHFIAYSQFISGLVLTAFSVLVIYWGFGVISLTVVYSLGSLLGLLIALFFCLKFIVIPVVKVDFAFWKLSLIRGLPFFLPTFVGLIGNRIGIILLSKLAGDASVGIYGAANNLVEKLLIIPDGICTAIYPTLAFLYSKSKDEAIELFQKFLFYLFLIGLPIAVAGTILAKQVILLIYGETYLSSVIILQILIWWLFSTFITSLLGWTLGAIHKEKKGAVVPFIVTPGYLVLNLMLIPFFKEMGVAIATLLMSIISAFLFAIFVRKHLVKEFISFQRVIKVLVSALIMGFFVYILKSFNLGIVVIAGGISYFVFLVIFRVIGLDDLEKIKLFLRKT
ncbi:MAG: flippase [Prolixibacteraceae bacterium]|nr:flippase [Prolixibacteraceae bacterium]